MGGAGVIFKSKKKTPGFRHPSPPGAGACVPLRAHRFPLIMQRLRDFYRRYQQYILSDALMYLVFILVLALMFLLFG
ncbi:hypothetical protein GCM10027048_08130 [Hymenobacter coalescens]